MRSRGRGTFSIILVVYLIAAAFRFYFLGVNYLGSAISQFCKILEIVLLQYTDSVGLGDSPGILSCVKSYVR